LKETAPAPGGKVEAVLEGLATYTISLAHQGQTRNTSDADCCRRGIAGCSRLWFSGPDAAPSYEHEIEVDQAAGITLATQKNGPG